MAKNKDRDLFDQQVVDIIEKEYSELIELYEVWTEAEKSKPKEEPSKEVKFAGVYKKDKDDKEEILPVITKEDGSVD